MTGQEYEAQGITMEADSIRTESVAQPELDSHFRKHAGVRRGVINHAQGVLRADNRAHKHTHTNTVLCANI